MKVSIIGAGNVGSTLASRILERDLADVVLVDIVGNLARAKALDLNHSAPILGFQSTCLGTDDYNLIKDSNVVIITAGLTRKPGISREDLFKKNLDIIRDISLKVKEFASKSIVIVVTNPLDIMTYTVLKMTNFKRERVIGMAGVLDCARFQTNIAENLKVPLRSIKALVMGMHSDTMIPVLSHTRISETKIEQLLSQTQLKDIIDKTKGAGAEIVSLLGVGSAYFAPSASAFFMVESILKGLKRTLVASVYLEGEYNISGVCLGVPVKLGKQGIDKIIEIKLSKEEEEALKDSALSLKQKLSKLSF
jgi:malate dehydrogenase